MRLSSPGLIARLKDQSTLVTSSTVLAAVASQQFTRSELEQGHLSWRRPAVYSLEAWIGNCWQEARYALPDLPSLLSPSQELLLWEQVIEHSGTELFDVSATALLAREALRLTTEWQVPLSDEGWKTHEDALQFQRWQAAFRKHCQANGWMTRNEALQQLPEWIESGVCAKQSMLFAGFHSPSRLLSSVFQVAGTLLSLHTPAPGVQHGHPVKMFEDLRGQIDAAARWARLQMQDQPGRSVGVFVPNLPDHRSLIDRTFRNVFFPGSGLRMLSERPLAGGDEQPVFHINRAQSLFENPIVASALLLLELAQSRIESTAATAILRSPFISGAASERSERAMADLMLRRMREMDVTLRDLERASSRSCPLLTQRWSKVREVLSRKPKKAELSAWSRFFGDLVQAAGWPGDIELTAAEQQVVEGWKDSLSSLASLGLVTSSVEFKVALARLRQILGAGGIQSGDWYSPVQILDASDAPGLKFDSSFFVGLSEETWPPPLRLSPLIPPQLQRAHGLPNSTPEALQAERIRLTAGLFNTSEQAWGTFSDRISPLAGPYVQLSQEPPPGWHGNVPLDAFPITGPDQLQDTQAPPVDISRGASGGTGIIKSQSLCAFRAFAEYRLRSQLPEDSCFGFDARDRGGFLHKALQYVWEELKDSEALRKTSETALRTLVRTSVEKAVTGAAESDFQIQTSKVERERLENLLMEWLIEVEKQRKIPFRVEQVEDELQFELSGLPLRLRIDRIDRLRDGGLMLIDYKSGPVTKGKLECPRPAEPQLLVYAAAKSPRVEGVLFGNVRARECRMVGIARDKHVGRTSVASLGDKWDDFIAKAEQEVTKLACEFLQGAAAVNPIKGACDFCNNKPFCRVNAAAGEAEDEA